MKKAPC